MGRDVKTTATATFFIVVTAIMTAVSARAQVADRLADEQRPAAPPEPAKPEKVPKALPPLFIVNDNIIGYYYLPTATNPGAGQTPKHVVVFNHFDVWNYGTNFLSVEWLKATNGKNPPFGTPASPCDQGGPLYPPGAEQCPGFTEIYGFVRSTFGWNQIFNTKAFSVGPLTNIEFAVGADLNTDNTTLGSAKKSIQGGLQFDFETPYRGFLNIGAYAYKEWQHDGFASLFPFQPIPNPSGNVEFDPTWAVEINYSQPLGSLPLKYKALVVIHGPKGCGEPCQPLGPGLVRTTEYLTQQLLVFDVGQAFWNTPQRFAIFAGYRWWKNKFGITPDQPNGSFIGTLESTWLMGAAVKF
ncbi:MAG TPA: hypothetical protein VFB29_01205 [Pseudolabrys sp.]|nr:hypothetical protein [Pseudolabrys sp.]